MALRVELATRTQAVIMQWAIIVLVVGIVSMAVVLVVEKDRISGSGNRPRSRGYHTAVLGGASACLALLLGVGALFFSRVRQGLRNELVW